MSTLTKHQINLIKQDNQREKEIDNAMDVIFHHLNRSSDQEIADLFLQKITNKHRTLQQGFWRAMFSVMESYGDIEYYDARNEHSVRACKSLSRKLDVVGLPYI
jgi:hypothetical protein